MTKFNQMKLVQIRDTLYDKKVINKPEERNTELSEDQITGRVRAKEIPTLCYLCFSFFFGLRFPCSI